MTWDIDKAEEWVFKPQILDVQRRSASEPAARYEDIVIDTARGEVSVRFYGVGGAHQGVVFCGGVGGGFDSPARGLYFKLPQVLRARDVSSIHLKYRVSTDLGEAVHDVLAAMEFLKKYGITRFVLVGHSFGGAVAIAVGVACREVVSVITLATQAFGTGAVSRFSPRSILCIHGMKDTVISPRCSRIVFRAANEPKRIVLLDGAGHCLDEAADKVLSLCQSWIGQALFEGDIEAVSAT